MDLPEKQIKQMNLKQYTTFYIEHQLNKEDSDCNSTKKDINTLPVPIRRARHVIPASNNTTFIYIKCKDSAQNDCDNRCNQKEHKQIHRNSLKRNTKVNPNPIKIKTFTQGNYIQIT
jgi:hypothetical protein